MAWDLFVDESGSFETHVQTNNGLRIEHNLIGGFLLPHGLFRNAEALNWFQEVKRQTVQKLEVGLLESINRFHPWFTKDGSLHEEFDFTHACNNQFVKATESQDAKQFNDVIRDAQLLMLDGYRRLITENEGFLVVFDEPTGTDFGGNLANYLTILGKGIVILYAKLQQLTGELEPELYLHIAMRPNKEKDENRNLKETDVVVLRGPNPKRIGLPQYQTSIKQMAMALADDGLRRLESFNALFNDPSRIVIEEDGQGAITIPCDFICNSFYRGSNNKRWKNTEAFTSAYFGERSVLIPVVEVNAIKVDEFAELRAYRSYFTMFMRIERLGFQSESVRLFFEAFNEADNRDQLAFVKNIEEELRQPVARSAGQGTMHELIARIEAMLRVFTERAVTDSTILNLLRSNLYLYEKALYIHLGLGDDTLRTEQLFLEAIKRVPRSAEKERLILMNRNQNIVAFTDQFRYGDAEKQFGELSFLHEYRLEASSLLYEGEDGGNEEYGKVIGSYLLLQRYRLCVSSPEYRDSCAVKLRDWCENALKQFSQPDDLCRCWLNICGIETELGDFNAAFRALGFAAAYSVEDTGAVRSGAFPPDSEHCAYILRASGIGSSTEGANPFVSYQYIRVLEKFMNTSNSENAKVLYSALGRNMLSPNSFAWIKNGFLRGIIQWRAAQVLIAQGETTGAVTALFRDAIDSIEWEYSSSLAAIVVAIHADYIAFLLGTGRWDKGMGESAGIEREYKAFKRLTEKACANNPFQTENENSCLEGYAFPRFEGTSGPEDVIEELLRLKKVKNAPVSDLRRIVKNLNTMSRAIAY